MSQDIARFVGMVSAAQAVAESFAAAAEAVSDHKRASWWHGRAADLARYLAELEREQAAAQVVDRG